jgi:hypothetical protein
MTVIIIIIIAGVEVLSEKKCYFVHHPPGSTAETRYVDVPDPGWGRNA